MPGFLRPPDLTGINLSIKVPCGCLTAAMAKTLINCPFWPFQTLLSQDQLLNDSRLAAVDADEWR